MNRTQIIAWATLAVLILVAFVLGGRRGLASKRRSIEMQEATTALQPVTQPATLATQLLGHAPSGEAVF